MSASIVITIPRAISLSNQNRDRHFRVRMKRMNNLAAEVRLLTLRKVPPRPFLKARVELIRYSLGLPDYDNLVGGCKELIDALKPNPKINFLGIIFDDSPSHIESSYQSVRVKTKAEQCTVVKITCLEP